MHRSMLFTALAILLPLGHAQNQAPIQHGTTVVVIDYFPAVSPSTVYETSVITVLGCPLWETNCPVRNGHTQAVVTATVGATTTVCPLTLSQARLSSFSTTVAPSEITGGPISTSSTTWPTVYSLPSSYPLPSSYDIPSSVWASIFPSGAPALNQGASAGSFDPGQFTGYPASSAASLSPEQASILGFPYGVSFSYHSSITTLGNSPTQSVNVTTGSFAAIVSSNKTAYFTTINAVTYNFSGSAGPTGYSGSNGTLSSLSPLTTVGNGTFVTGVPLPQQTINVGPTLPVNLFSLLVAISAVAFAL